MCLVLRQPAALHSPKSCRAWIAQALADGCLLGYAPIVVNLDPLLFRQRQHQSQQDSETRADLDMNAVRVANLHWAQRMQRGQGSAAVMAKRPRRTSSVPGCTAVVRENLGQSLRDLNSCRCMLRAAINPALATSPSCGQSSRAVAPRAGTTASRCCANPTKKTRPVLLLGESEYWCSCSGRGWSLCCWCY